MFSPENYTIAAALLPRLLGFIYFFAFGAFLFQIRGLLGHNGILPIDTFLKLVKKRYSWRCFRLIPTLFWINSSNAALMGVVIAGTAISIALMLGFYPALCLFLSYCLYISIVSAGQDFLSFGWEGFFLEITVNAFFLSLTTPPNPLVWISINLLLFRFFFQGGAVKLQSRDPNWENLTALAYHYQSQPIPNMVAWYMHKLPLWFHKLSTELMFIVELIVPFFIFGPDLLRLLAFAAFIFLLVGIWATGNFSYLNHLSTVFCIILVSNTYLAHWFAVPHASDAGLALNLLCTVAGATLLTLQLLQLCNHFLYNPVIAKWLQFVSPFHIANRYGIFAVMTTTRNEVVFEGKRRWNRMERIPVLSQTIRSDAPSAQNRSLSTQD